MKMIAKIPFTYARRDLVAGDEFDARDVDAELLRAIGKAHTGAAATPAKQSKRKYNRRDMTADKD